jgi:alkylhydroperoxidase family enzyme
MTYRIQPLDPTQAASVGAEHRLPEVQAQLNVFRVLLHNAPVAKAVSDLIRFQLRDRGVLDARLRELIILRIGWLTGSAYEWTQHYPIAQAAGLSDHDVIATRDWENDQSLTDVERAVLRATDEYVRSGMISDETWETAAALLVEDPAQRVSVVTAIATWTFVSGLLRTLAIPLEPDALWWPPDGQPPT